MTDFLKYWLLNILVFYKPSSSEEALLSPHSVLTSFKMWLILFLILRSRISACVLDSNFLFGGKSRPLCTANSSNSYNTKIKSVHNVFGTHGTLYTFMKHLFYLESIPFWRQESASPVCGNTAEGSTTVAFSGIWHTVVGIWQPLGGRIHLREDDNHDKHSENCIQLHYITSINY